MLVVISTPTRFFVRPLKSLFCYNLIVCVDADVGLTGSRQQGAPERLGMTPYVR